MIYFDNAATCGTRPFSVINSALNAIKNLSANPGRSGHKLSIECGRLITETRGLVCDFLGGESLSNVIFTKNCTEATNLAILGCVKKNGHVITTANEHNSILRPLFFLEQQGIIELTVIQPDSYGVVTAEQIKNQIRENTYLICVNHASNVTGATCDLFEIGKLTSANNLLLLVDTAQSAGHIDIDCKKFNIDMLCFAGHKGLLSIQGLGGLVFSNRVKLSPLMYGGTGTDSDKLLQPTYSPEGFESGTLNGPAILSLKASLEYLQNNYKKHQLILDDIQSYLYKSIKDLKNFEIYSQKNHCGIITISHKNYTSTEVSEILDEKYNIATRSGLHCAPLIHKHLGTLEKGLVRISASAFNSKQDADRLIYALYNISKK